MQAARSPRHNRGSGCPRGAALAYPLALDEPAEEVVARARFQVFYAQFSHAGMFFFVGCRLSCRESPRRVVEMNPGFLRGCVTIGRSSQGEALLRPYTACASP